jgi:hypothetical protein
VHSTFKSARPFLERKGMQAHASVTLSQLLLLANSISVLPDHSLSSRAFQTLLCLLDELASPALVHNLFADAALTLEIVSTLVLRLPREMDAHALSASLLHKLEAVPRLSLAAGDLRRCLGSLRKRASDIAFPACAASSSSSSSSEGNPLTALDYKRSRLD